MSNNYDIVMDSDETLELDTIIRESNIASDPITKFKHTEDSTDHLTDLTSIQTNTVIFEPPKPGQYKAKINGQIITINVKDVRKEIIVDNYEDGDISEYYGETGNYSISGVKTFEGSYALYNGGNNDSIYSRSGLEKYPRSGDVFQIRTYHSDDNAGSSFGFVFNSNNKGNYAGYHGGNNDWFITNLDDGPDNGATEYDENPQSGQWWKWIVKWYEDGSADFTVYDDSDNIIAGPITYNNAGKYVSEGIWFSTAHQSGNHNHWWDNYKIIGST